MKLLKSLSSIIALTSCAIVMFLIRRKKIGRKFSIFHKILEEEENDSQDSKQDYEIPELPNPKWVKVGRVEKLHLYPLNLGPKKSYSTVKFTRHGIIAVKKGMILRDRMFQVYDEKTNEFQSAQNLKSTIDMNVVHKSKVRFSGTGMPDLTINLKESNKTLAELKTNWIVIRYIDCGDAAADWVNIYLRKFTLRLIRSEYDIIDKPKINQDSFEKKYDVEAWRMLMTLTRYVVVTSASLKKLQTETPLQFSKIQPNIVISAPSFPAFAEANWEWMKIGNNIIMRKILPVPSVISREKSQNVDCKQPQFLGIFYGLYFTGNTTGNVNDDVFIHMKKEPDSDSGVYSNDTNNTNNIKD